MYTYSLLYQVCKASVSVIFQHKRAIPSTDLPPVPPSCHGGHVNTINALTWSRSLTRCLALHVYVLNDLLLTLPLSLLPNCVCACVCVLLFNPGHHGGEHLLRAALPARHPVSGPGPCPGPALWPVPLHQRRRGGGHREWPSSFCSTYNASFGCLWLWTNRTFTQRSRINIIWRQNLQFPLNAHRFIHVLLL